MKRSVNRHAYWNKAKQITVIVQSRFQLGNIVNVQKIPATEFNITQDIAVLEEVRWKHKLTSLSFGVL